MMRTFGQVFPDDGDGAGDMRIVRLGNIRKFMEFTAMMMGEQIDLERFTIKEENEARFYRKWSLERPHRIAYLLNGRSEAPPEIRERLRELANAGHRVWVFHRGKADGRTIPRHFQVVPQRLGRFGFWPRATARILFKKKRFHRILLPRGPAARAFQWLQPIHRAEVV